MLIAAFMLAGVYTVFAPMFAGRKHLLIGLALLVVFGVLIYALK